MSTAAVPLSGRVLDANRAPVRGLTLQLSLLTPDENLVPIDPKATTDGEGRFQISLSGDFLPQLLTGGAGLFFRIGESTGTVRAPLHLRADHTAAVVLVRRDLDSLEVESVERDGRPAPGPITFTGRVVDLQGQPVAALSLAADLRVPVATQISSVVLRNTDGSQPMAETDADGRFRLTVERGDLLPCHPYPPYPWSLIGSQAGKTAETPKESRFYAGPGEAVDLSLQWDPAAPALTLLQLRRNDAPARPAEGLLRSLGQLLDEQGVRPRAGFRVGVTVNLREETGVRTVAMGEVTTQEQGYFPLFVPWPLQMDPAAVPRDWTLTVWDPDGREMTSGLKVQGSAQGDDPVQVKVALKPPVDTSPTLEATSQALGITLSAETRQLLDRKGIRTLQNVLQQGGLRHLQGWAPADADALARLERQASLCSVLPPSIEAGTALQLTKKLADEGTQGAAEVGLAPRSEMTRRTAGILGDFRAAQLHHVAAARANFLDALLLGARVEQRMGTADETGPELPEAASCSCEECQTAVSPNAYLMDLLRYTTSRVRKPDPDTTKPPLPVTADDLQALFHQPFADLPVDCDAMKQALPQVRIAIEVLRSYKATLTIGATAQAALDTAETSYRQAAHDALLNELGTSSAELRLARGNNARLLALAERLNLPSKTEVERLLPQTLTEAALEEVFGLRDTTRAPGNRPPEPLLPAWRLAVLRRTWRQQDQLTPYPADQPILDPDTVLSTDLRLGWNATHPVTVLWSQRRQAVDAQLSTLWTGRHTAVGSAVLDQLVPAATADEKLLAWVAFFVANLTEAEVQSAAASLPPDRQAEARQRAAEQKVLQGKLRRGETGPPTKAERGVIIKVLALLDSAVRTAAQTATDSWIDARFTELADKDNKKLTLAEWQALHGVLKGTDSSQTPDLARQRLAAFFWTADAFTRAWDLRLVAKGKGFRTLGDADWDEFDALFTSRWKATQEAVWVTEERSKVTITADFFWLDPEEPALRKELGSPERRRLWNKALESALTLPVIEPDLLRPELFRDTADAAVPFSLFRERQRWVADTLTALATKVTEVKGAVTAKRREELDKKLLAPALLVPESALTSRTPRWFDLDALATAHEQGTLPSGRIAQLLLTRTALAHLLRVRSLLAAQQEVTEGEWKDLQDILLQVQKRRRFVVWRREEAEKGISLSTEIFQLPLVPVEFPPRPRPELALPAWRTDRIDFLDWQDRLAGREQQEKDLRQVHLDLVRRVEEATLPALRSALITACAPPAAGTSPAARATWLADRLLVDLTVDASFRTTRIAHATQTLQLLVFGLRSGQLFQRREAATQALYHVLSLNADHFETEWQWMGSYATWRSALFVFMYPENLLHPTLRRTEEQSQAFKELVDRVRDSSRLKPQDACKAAEVYQRYLEEVTSLEVHATCTARVALAPEAGCAGARGLVRRELFFAFAVAKNGAPYWCTRRLDQGTDSPWQPISGLAGPVERIFGAVPAETPDGKRLIVLVARVRVRNNNGTPGALKLQLQHFDLDRYVKGNAAWDAEAKELEDLPLTPTGGDLRCRVFVEQSVQEDIAGVFPQVHIHLEAFSAVPHLRFTLLDHYRRPLSNELTGWAPGPWSSFLVRTDEYNVKAVFRTSRDGWTSFEYNQWQSSSYFLRRGTESLTIPFPSSGFYKGAALLGGGLVQLAFDERDLVYNIGGAAPLAFRTGYRRQPFDLYDLLVPNCLATNPPVHARVPAVYRKGIVVINQPFGNRWIDWFGTLPAPSPQETRFEFVRQARLVPTLNPPVAVAPASPAASLEDRRRAIAKIYEDHQLGSSHWGQLDEAFFAVPVHLALQLQQGGHYQAALDWWRTVYDWTAPLDGRKVFHGLKLEETYDAGYQRPLDWLSDPLNPYAVAANRRNTYSRFTLQALIRCLLDYGDAEYAKDSPESLPRARVLYEQVRLLLDAPELKERPGPCEEIVGTLDLSIAPAEFAAVAVDLRERLAAIGDPARLATAVTQVRAAVGGAGSWGQRFQQARSAIEGLRRSAPPPPAARALLAADRALREQAHLALLGTAPLRTAAAEVNRLAGRSFRASMARLTGVPATRLDAPGTALRFAWLSRPTRPLELIQAGQRVVEAIAPPEEVTAEHRQAVALDPLAPRRAAIEAQMVVSAPETVLAHEVGMADPVLYLASAPAAFCIPVNPLLRGLRFRTEVNLFKLASCRDIAGNERSLDLYAGPTDAATGLPTATAGGRIALPGSTRLLPTAYRYPLLVERARRLTGLAAQFESLLLQALEKRDAEQRNLLDARNHLQLQRAQLSLKQMEVEDAQLSVQLVERQQDRVLYLQGYLQGLIDEDLSTYEEAALGLLSTSAALEGVAAVLQTIAAGTYTAANANVFVSGAAAAAGIAAAAAGVSGLARVSTTLSQVLSMKASFERRKQDWTNQKQLADFDALALGVQWQQAGLRVRIKEREQEIAGLTVEHAQATVDFLLNKFTNRELYEWMARVLQGLYAELLQQATAAARLAERQLAFERLEELQFIQTDYWEAQGEGSGSGQPDRLGLTGSARLGKDVEKLEEFALTTDRRRLQLFRTISLAAWSPGEFQRFRETGQLWFETSEKDFDREFPGHYFRRIRKVRVSVVALVPPVQGIRATLSNLGPSRVVVPGIAGFESRVLPPSHGSIAFTSPREATGLFELDIQPDLLLPFEGVGVDTQWLIELPRAANFFDYDTLADVLVTFEYTALNSPDYRQELLADPRRLPRTVEAMRVWSLRNDVPDAWYALHNGTSGESELRAGFEVRREDFPTGLDRLKVRRISFYMPVDPDGDLRVDLRREGYFKDGIGLAIGAGATPAQQALDEELVLISRFDSQPWLGQIAGRAPFGPWSLVLPATLPVRELFQSGRVRDVLIAVSYQGDLPPWPSGPRQRAPF